MTLPMLQILQKVLLLLPMLLIRNAAADIGIGSPDQTVTYDPATDIISRGIIAIQDVYDLLAL
jgi:hypothetical protein